MSDALRIFPKSQPSSPSAERATHSPVPAGAKDKSILVSRGISKLCLFTARTLLVFLGCAAVSWGIYGLPAFARQVPIERVATHVLKGDPFKSGVLTALMPQVEAAEGAEPCNPVVMRSAAIIRTRMAERAIVDGVDIDTQLNALRDSIRRSLACSPADPFLWVVLYWVEINRSGFQLDHLKYLRLSYQLGPNEGWIALKRNGYSLAIFDRLPPNLAHMVVAEFADLLNSGFVIMTVEIIEGPGWSHRELLLSHLTDVTSRYRDEFARKLYKDGYDVTVPGIAQQDPRPWD
jgi:hypothetical protein